ncbi:MAG: hypothetical protein LBL94_03650 [Prevotellaceae bacterium]|nr:hypothetical protein [Prevotellaceae bacterium]
MKKMLLATLFATCLTMPALPGCTPNIDEPEFDNYVMLPDGDLPKYTEYGFNTAGAKITTANKHGTFDQIWTLSAYGYGTAGARISKTESGTVRFSMSGYKMPYSAAELSFEFQAEISDSLAGLQALVNQNFSLQQRTLLTEFQPNGENLAERLNITSASLRFTRSRIIYTNSGERRGVSLSGTFELAGTFIENGENANMTVSSGRFDILFRNSYGVDNIEFSNAL